MAGGKSNIATDSTVEELMWRWFGYKRSDVQQTTAICKKCKKIVTTKGGNTTKLFPHLKLKHPVEYEESKRSYQEYFVILPRYYYR